MGNPCNPVGAGCTEGPLGHVTEAESRVAAATTDVALALGLVRVLTLLPLHDPALDEVERHLAAAWDSLLELRRSVADRHALASGPRSGQE